AGSKPELVAALAMHKDAESLIICNGYKDQAFIRIALLGRKLGKLVVIVVEKLEELEQTIRAASEVGVEPMIGIRVRLHSKGSGSDFDSSANYSLQEYANDVVWNIMDVCDSEGVPHPAIVNEGGRAVVAHHSVLVVEAFSSIEKTAPKIRVEATEKDHKLVHDILDVKQRLKRGNRIESLHDIQQIKEEAQETFNLGLLEPESKAKIDTLYWQLAQQIANMHRGLKFVPEEVKDLETTLGDQYICNFSVFQSLLDHWALGQLFPIMPIHRLTTPPDRQGTIVDITCDSDGKVSKFTDLQDVRETLPLHRVIPGEIYYLGVFMVGA